MTTQALIELGLTTNAFVYDKDAAPGNFSPRLGHLMEAFIRYRFMTQDRAKVLFVPSWVQFYTDGGPVQLAGGTFMGVPVQGFDADADDEYIRQGGVYGGGKHHIVAALARSGKVVLGGF